ncbi:hypothetical protein H1C71_007185 [Ictidomys tridecemlineatus]|nr:hypothetical protein H1C71_007185 [Ictidomys tridecemlineatus]
MATLWVGLWSQGDMEIGGWPFQKKGSQLCPSGLAPQPLLSSACPCPIKEAVTQEEAARPLTVKCQLPASGTELAWPGPAPGACRLLIVGMNSDTCASREPGPGGPRQDTSRLTSSSVALKVELKAYPEMGWDESPLGWDPEAEGSPQAISAGPGPLSQPRGRPKPGVGGSLCCVLCH